MWTDPSAILIIGASLRGLFVLPLQEGTFLSLSATKCGLIAHVVGNAGPRSLSAPSAHPPQSRAGSPTRLADRKEPVVLTKHVSGPKTAHTHPASRRVSGAKPRIISP